MNTSYSFKEGSTTRVSPNWSSALKTCCNADFSSFYPFPGTSMQWFSVYKAKSIHCPLLQLRDLPWTPELTRPGATPIGGFVRTTYLTPVWFWAMRAHPLRQRRSPVVLCSITRHFSCSTAGNGTRRRNCRYKQQR